MKNLVIYDSYFGNTEKLAKSIGKKLGIEAINVKESKLGQLKCIDYLILGSPTRGFRPTEAMVAFLNSIPEKGLNNVKVLIFDTRIDMSKITLSILKFLAKSFGYAGKIMKEMVESKGGMVITEPEGFFVDKSEGPLRDGEERRATDWVTKNIK